ncbi:MAG: sulfatase-like hydrolase/transferase, partial [Opitutae bacterium]|nr:sulfatase-like hydrolase/transferase [Opitutae bacterium]
YLGSMKNLFSRKVIVVMAYARHIVANPRKYLLPHFIIVAIAIVAVLLTRATMPEGTSATYLELVSASRFAWLVLSVIWFALFFAVLRKVPLWIRGIIIALFFLPCAFSVYLKINYGMEIDYGFIMDCANTHPEEVASYFSFGAIFNFLAFVAAMFVVAWVIGKIPAELPHAKIFAVLIVGVAAFAEIQLELRAAISPVYIVLTSLNSAWRYHTGDAAAFELLADLENTPQEVSRVPAEISHVNSAPIVVLHIGESARADHAPFNGYARNTMPNMLREYEAGNLVSFPICVSFSVKTVLSMRGILSPSTVLDNAFRHPTFIPALNQSGVATCGFFSAHSINSEHEAGVVQICNPLEEKISTTELAGTLLPKIREILAAKESAPKQQQFYLYYGEGSHTPYIWYDFDKHAVFKPNSRLKSTDECNINNYDNTFVATDEFCGGFIDALRDKNAVYIFVGDHGDMLGEDGLWGRQYRRPETRHVLFFVWASDKFKAENPELWATLSRNNKRLATVSQDFVYNSVLHLFGLKTPYYDERADLFSDNAEPFPTELPDAKEFGPLRFGENAETAIRWKSMEGL